MLSAVLVKTIDEELRWRELEMALSKIQLHRAIGDLHAFRYAYRCIVAMTYAHFEGFVKRVLAQALVDLVGSGHRSRTATLQFKWHSWRHSQGVEPPISLTKNSLNSSSSTPRHLTTSRFRRRNRSLASPT